MTFDALIGGLIFAVSCLLAHGMVDNLWSVARFRLAGNVATWRTWVKLSNGLFCAGILIIGGLQTYDRVMPGGIPARLRGDAIGAAWALFLVSILVGQSTLIANKRGVRAARVWLALVLISTTVLAVVGAASGRFHAPIFVKP